MSQTLFLLGDINLMGETDPDRPFRFVAERLKGGDVVFANLECCFYDCDDERSVDSEGFYASTAITKALHRANVHVIGNANNVNFGPAAIRASLDALDAEGVLHCGAGIDSASAYAPVIIERDGVKYGFMQRTSVYWQLGHEADEGFPGVATIKGHTAYRPLVENSRALTRPGVPPEIVTWADPLALEAFREDIAALRTQVDILVSSNHWGLDGEVLGYMREISHAAIDAGADIVFGHGPHVPLPVEFYKGKPVLYGSGSFSFQTGHRAMKHPDWLGWYASAEIGADGVGALDLSFVRHNDVNETLPRIPADESADFEDLKARSALLGARLTADGAHIRVEPI